MNKTLINYFPFVHQVNKSKARHRRLRELQAPGNVQWMGLLSERLYVGYQSGFTRYRCSHCLSADINTVMSIFVIIHKWFAQITVIIRLCVFRCPPQCPWWHVCGQPPPPWGPHPSLYPPAGPGCSLCCGDFQQRAAAVLQLHWSIRGLAGPEVASAGADVASCAHRCLWVKELMLIYRKRQKVLKIEADYESCFLFSRLQRSLPVSV